MTTQKQAYRQRRALGLARKRMIHWDNVRTDPASTPEEAEAAVKKYERAERDAANLVAKGVQPL